MVQSKDAALVLDGQAEIAARAGADGAHLTGIEAFMAAVESLKPARIAGCGGLSSRDDAMLAGEHGADYVMFGEPAAAATPSFVRGDHRAHRMVGRAVHDSLRRLCGRIRRKSAHWSPRAPISSPSATASGTIRAVPRRLSRRPRGSLLAPERVRMNASTLYSRAVSPRSVAAPAAAQPKSARGPIHDAKAGHNRRRRTGLAYAEYQRGNYVTAFRQAMRRVEEKSDPKAMTLLGELYADGLGVANDDKKAADWYKLAVARNDREAMFALAMFRMAGRGGPADRPEAARLLAEAAKLGHVVGAYDLALLYLEGQLVPQDFNRAAELMRMAADAGNPQAQYALATFYKDGRGVRRMPKKPRACSASRRARAIPMPKSNTPSPCSTAQASPRTRAPLPAISSRRPRKSNPVAQNRLALMYATGRGIKADPVEAARWHLIAKAGGNNDQSLDEFMRNMKPTDRAMGENKAKPWIARMNPVGPTPFPDGARPYQLNSQAVKP